MGQSLWVFIVGAIVDGDCDEVVVAKLENLWVFRKKLIHLMAVLSWSHSHVLSEVVDQRFVRELPCTLEMSA